MSGTRIKGLLVPITSEIREMVAWQASREFRKWALVAKMQLNPQIKNKAAFPLLVYDLIFPEGDVWDARPL
jgi:hypothetical protein